MRNEGIHHAHLWHHFHHVDWLEFEFNTLGEGWNLWGSELP
jgi:hypothetical protein